MKRKDIIKESILNHIINEVKKEKKPMSDLQQLGRALMQNSWDLYCYLKEAEKDGNVTKALNHIVSMRCAVDNVSKYLLKHYTNILDRDDE